MMFFAVGGNKTVSHYIYPIRLTFVFLCLLFLSANYAQAQLSDAKSYVVEGEYIIKRPAQALVAKGDSLSDKLAPLVSSIDKNAFSGYELVQENFLAADGPGAGAIVPAESAANLCPYILLQAEPGTTCEPNYVLKIDALPTDSLYEYLWGMEKISAPAAWNTNTGSKEVVVAVIDTGVDYTHPDLSENMWINKGERPNDGIDNDGNGYVDDVYGIDTYGRKADPMDDHGHGTHCAGTIGAVANNGQGVAGVSWNVRIMGVKFLSSSGSGTTYGAIQAIEYATMMGAQIINASWGGYGTSAALRDAMAVAQQAGVIIVAAAGNSGRDNDALAHYPSSYTLDNIVAVAATDSNDELAYFSNYGAESVDVAAPGVSILSTYAGGRYAVLSGTSMATPHVSGLAALILSEYPNATYQEVITRIKYGDALANLAKTTHSGTRINAVKALSENYSAPRPTTPKTNVEFDYLRNTLNKKNNLLYANAGYEATVNGDAGVTVSISMRLEGRMDALTCEIGEYTLDDSGNLDISGRLKLGKLAKFIKKVTLSANEVAVKARVRFKNKKKKRTTRSRNKAKDSSNLCNKLQSALYIY